MRQEFVGRITGDATAGGGSTENCIRT
jgi:hypothetical protein